MKAFFLILVLVPIVTSSLSCPPGMIQYVLDQNICYYFGTQTLPYKSAEELCIKYNGHLTSIQSMFESDFVAQIAQIDFNATNNFWIGASDLTFKGKWEWSDGTDFTFTDWDNNQPQNLPGYDCGAVVTQDGKWISDDCFANKNFVCKVMASSSSATPLSTTIASEPTKCDETWQYYDLTGFCYKVFSYCHTWNDAKKNCNSLNSKLASIHSETENFFVTGLIPFDKTQNECKNDTHTNNFAAFGMYNTEDNSTWQWTDKSPFDFSPKDTPARNGYNCGCVINGPLFNRPFGSWGIAQCYYPVGHSVCKKLPN